ncbi:MAG: L-threonylcarbamoyladenylate synthase [Bacteroidota bacterium]
MQSKVQEAIAVLQKGGVIVHPTDTIPGLACDATRPEAVDKIYKIKARDPEKPLLMLVNGPDMLHQYVSDIPLLAEQLVAQFPDVPLTMIYPRAKGVAPNLPHPSGSIGIRITRHPLSLQLIRGLGGPIASTSANLSGQPNPDRMANIHPEVLNQLDYTLFLPAAETEGNPIPSWVIKAETDRIQILRKGIDHEGLENWISQTTPDSRT